MLSRRIIENTSLSLEDEIILILKYGRIKGFIKLTLKITKLQQLYEFFHKAKKSKQFKFFKFFKLKFKQ
jgi:hypothetical protein